MLTTIEIHRATLDEDAVSLPLFLIDSIVNSGIFHTIMINKGRGCVHFMGDQCHKVFHNQSLAIMEIIELSGACYLGSVKGNVVELFLVKSTERPFKQETSLSSGRMKRHHTKSYDEQKLKS